MAVKGLKVYLIIRNIGLADDDDVFEVLRIHILDGVVEDEGITETMADDIERPVILIGHGVEVEVPKRRRKDAAGILDDGLTVEVVILIDEERMEDVILDD